MKKDVDWSDVSVTFNHTPDAPTVTLESIADAVAEIERVAGPLPKWPEPPYTYPIASLFIDGEEVGRAFSWNYQPKTPAFAPRILLGPETYECSITVSMRRRTWTQLVRALLRPRRLHASFETLMRRALYGGRKGRRAMRRLLAMSDATWRHELRSREPERGPA